VKRRLYNWGMLSSVIVLIAGLIITTLWFYTYEVDNIKQEKKILIKKITDLKITILKTWQKERASELRFISNNDQFAKIVKEYTTSRQEIIAGEMNNWLQQLLKNHNYSGYFLLDRKNETIYKKITPSYLEHLEIESFYLNDSINIFYKHPTESQNLYSCLSAPIKYNESVIGYMVLVINLNKNILAELIEWPELDDAGEILFADSSFEQILFTKSEIIQNIQNEFINWKIGSEDSVVETTDSSGKNYLTYSKQIEGTSWSLISRLEMAKVYSRIESFSNYFLTANLGLIIIVCFLLYYYVRKKDVFVNQKIKTAEDNSAFLNQKFNQLQENANDVIFLLNPDGKIVECNLKAVNLYGYSKEELLQKSVHDLKKDEDKKLTDYYLDAISKKGNVRFESIHYSNSGREIPVEISAAKIELNKKSYLQSIIRDISERKAAEKRIITLNRYYSLLSKTNQIVVKYDNEKTIFDKIVKTVTSIGKFDLSYVAINEGSQFKYSAVSIKEGEVPGGIEEHTFVFPDEISQVLDSGNVVIERNLNHDDHLVSMIGNLNPGSLKSCAIFPLKIKSKLYGVLALYHKLPNLFHGEELNLLSEMATDLVFALISIENSRERQNAEIKLRENERRLLTLMSNLPGMAYRCRNDEYWTMLFVSEGCFELTGYHYEELLHNKKTSFASIIFPPDREPVVEKINLALARKSQFNIEYRIITRDKKIKWVGEKGVGVKDNNFGELIEGFITDITEIKKAEEAVRNSRDFYLYLFNHLPFPIFKTDADGKVDYVNDSWSNYTGITANETFGFGWLKAVYFEDYIKFREIYLEALNKKDRYEYELRLKTGAGEYRWAIVNGIPYKDHEGDFAGYLGSFYDINERKKALENLDRSEKVYRELFENNPQPMWIYEVDSLKFKSVNDAAVNHYQYSKEEFLTMTLLDIRPESEFPKFLGYVREKEEVFQLSTGWKHKKKDGSVIDVEIKSHALPELDGEKVRLVVAIDVTERNQAYRLLKESEESFKNIYKNTSIGLFTMDTEGIITMANPAFLDMMGIESIDELNVISKTKDIIYGNVNAKKIRGKLFETGEVPGYETEWVNNRGRRMYIRVNLKQVEKEGGFYIEGTIEDISSKKEAEQQLIRAKDEAVKSAQLKSNFLAQMSHEIRTPINVIVNFVNLIREKYAEMPKDEELEFSFEAIDSAGHRIIRTIDMILNMSQLQAGGFSPKIERIELNQEIINPLCREFSSSAEERGIKLIFAETEQDYIVLGDNYATKQIFSNLIDNALKYTREGSVEIIIEEEETSILGIIKDTGIGIEQKFLEVIFEPFSQEEEGYSRKYEGNGLGLALVKNYCELNKYEIKIESQKGEGTIVAVKMPKG